MKKSTHAIAILMGMAACSAGPALAQGAAPAAGGPMSFEAFDRNGDGAVTEQEFYASRADRMSARASAGAPMRGAASAPAFAEMDLDRDGKMTRDELSAFRQGRMQGGRGMGAGQARGPGMGMGPGAGRGMGRNMPAFSDFDLNADGTLTEQEFYQGRATRMAERAQQGYPMRNIQNAQDFNAIDQNRDGKVTPQEFATAQAEHRQQMMQQPMTPPSQP